MSEKLKTQQRANELETLAHELQVLTQENVQQAEQGGSDSRYLLALCMFKGNVERYQECLKYHS